MPLQSDITLEGSKFAARSITKKTTEVNEGLIKIMEDGPMWYEVGAEKYRRMRWNGETPLPAPAVLKEGINTSIPSRDKGRDIPCRVFTPTDGKARGVFMHIHGGGWVLQSEAYQDSLLKFISDSAELTVVSVGYRLAPEDPFPAGPEDCYDAGEWLVDHAKERFDSDLLFLGGESAGGHLSMLTCLHLVRARPKFQFRGLNLHFGAFDIAGFMPAAHGFTKPLVINYDIMVKYTGAFVPNSTEAQRRDPSISPLYANLVELAKLTPTGKLPPALFTCGTEDPLLDDTVFMSAKWMMSGAEAIVKIYPGAPHGFILFPPEAMDSAQQSREDVRAFLREKVN